MLAANVIGFVGTDDKGLDGIEQQFDGMIKGEEQTSSILQMLWLDRLWTLYFEEFTSRC